MTADARPPIPLPEAPPLALPDDFDARLAALGVTLDDVARGRLADYLARLLAMNERMNLTAITEPAEAWSRHGLDALTLVPLLAPLKAGASYVDVGAGGGVPGIPVAIARPDLRVTLVESTQKKAAFLTAVTAALGLANVTVRPVRAEQAIAAGLRGRFDAVSARAVGRIAVLAPITVPLAKRGGVVLLIKGQRADEELDEARDILRDLRCAHERTVDTPTGRVVVLRADGGQAAPRRG